MWAVAANSRPKSTDLLIKHKADGGDARRHPSTGATRSPPSRARSTAPPGGPHAAAVRHALRLPRVREVAAEGGRGHQPSDARGRSTPLMNAIDNNQYAHRQLPARTRAPIRTCSTGGRAPRCTWRSTCTPDVGARGGAGGPRGRRARRAVPPIAPCSAAAVQRAAARPAHWLEMGVSLQPAARHASSLSAAASPMTCVYDRLHAPAACGDFRGSRGRGASC